MLIYDASCKETDPYDWWAVNTQVSLHIYISDQGFLCQITVSVYV